jgi:hypothetical protein
VQAGLSRGLAQAGSSRASTCPTSRCDSLTLSLSLSQTIQLSARECGPRSIWIPRSHVVLV